MWWKKGYFLELAERDSMRCLWEKNEIPLEIQFTQLEWTIFHFFKNIIYETF